MEPALVDRLAKLLRLACCQTAPDGERLAAIGKVSATVAAHDICWDRVLANGNGTGLDEKAASRIYWEGHARGVSETEQRLRPQRDWTPASGTSAKAGKDSSRIKTILEAAARAAVNGDMTEWETQFIESMSLRFRQFSSRMYVSEKQWAVLDRLETKLRRAGYSFAHCNGAT